MGYMSRLLGREVRTEKGTIALVTGEEADIKRIAGQVLNTFNQDEQVLLKEKQVLQIIKEAEVEIKKLEADVGTVNALMKIDVEIDAQAKKELTWSRPTAALKALQDRRLENERKLNYEINIAQKLLSDIFMKIDYIMRLYDAIRRSKVLQVKEDTNIEKWAAEAGNRARTILRFMQQFNVETRVAMRASRAPTRPAIQMRG